MCILHSKDVALCTHTHSGILFGLKKGAILPFATWMDVENIMLSELSWMKKGN